MGYGHYRIALAIASAAKSLGLTPYWLDFLAFPQSAASKTLRYLNDLAQSNTQLPRRNGEPNKVEISRQCGFGRHVLYNQPSVIAILDQFEAKERHRLGFLTLDPISRLMTYLARLEETNTSLPRSRNDKPNIKAIAEACGFNRNIFYKNIETMTLLNSACANERIEEIA